MDRLRNSVVSLFGSEEREVAGRRLTELSQISAGTSSAVFEVRDASTGEVFALKEITCEDGPSLAFAMREVQVLQDLPHHKNIVGYFGHTVLKPAETGRQLWRVLVLLELCPGGDLLELMARHKGALSERKVLRVLTDVSEALFSLHSHEPAIQHRNLKLENVLRGRDGSWKIVGFGSCSSDSVDVGNLPPNQLAKVSKELQRGIKAQYIPPEMLDLKLRLRISCGVDMWMLGCILFALLYNRLPFRPGEKLAICSAQFLLPARKTRATPKLVDLLVWLLASEPQHRPNARTLAEVVWQWKDSEALELPEPVVEHRNKLIAHAAAVKAHAHGQQQPEEEEKNIVASGADMADAELTELPEPEGTDGSIGATAASSLSVEELEREFAAATKRKEAAASRLAAAREAREAEAEKKAAMAVASTTPTNGIASQGEVLERAASVPDGKSVAPEVAIKEIAKALEDSQRSVTELLAAAGKLVERSGLVAQRLQWGAKPDQIALQGESFASASEAVEAAAASMNSLVRWLRAVSAETFPKDLHEQLRKLEETHHAAVETMGRTKASGILPTSGPSREQYAEDSRVLQAWEAKLRWEAAFSVLERGVWKGFVESMGALLDDGSAAQGTASVDKNTGEANGPPIPGTDKAVQNTSDCDAAGVPKADTAELDATAAVAAARRQMPLFGQQTCRPHDDMLCSLRQDYRTFVNCLEEQRTHVASIDRAFGGRGMLLIHACVADNAAPQAQKRSRAGSGAETNTEGIDLESRFLKVVKGAMGPMGDRRRIALEIRFKRLSVRFAGELARAINSLDFGAYDCLAAAGHLDAGTFIPSVSITASPAADAAETSKINEVFLLPQEREALAAIEASGRVEELHGLEKRLLPLVHVRAFAEKAKLFHIRLAYPVLEASAIRNYQEVARACDALRESRCLLDLLSVTLQIASYVAQFGSIELSGRGFTLLKLQHYEDFKVGKRHSFLSVLCAFLMNLRPRGFTHASPGTQERGQRGPSFVDRLVAELADVREVHEKGLSMPEIQLQATQLEEMLHFVERQLADERALFQPEAHQTEATTASPMHLYDELEAWACGRQRLQELLEGLRGSLDAVRGAAKALANSDRDLKEFAAVRGSDPDSCSYLEIFGSVLQYVDRLNRTSQELRLNPNEHLELRSTLLAAAPLQIVFSADSLAAAFDLWLRKAVTPEVPSVPWCGETKAEVVRELFRLFDADADDTVDAEELRVTVQAFGVTFPAESDAFHCTIVRLFDGDNNGRLELAEFQKFVEARIQAVFRQFLKDPSGKGSDAIVDTDLERVAAQLGRDGVTQEIRERMIHALDTEEDGQVNMVEFEQLILMRQENAALRPEDDDRLNRPLPRRLTRSPISMRSSPKAWIVRGDPGDGGSSSDSDGEFPVGSPRHS